MLKAVNHVQITVPPGSEARAREFYCGLLGLREIEKPAILKANGGLWLQLGTIQIHIGVEENAKRPGGKAHIAYEVEDLDVWRHRLEAANHVILESKQIPGCRRFEFRDPFGNRVEFIQVFR